MSVTMPSLVRGAGTGVRPASGVRRRVHTQWLALGAALVVLSGVMVAWGLSRAAERVQVVQMARDVPAGHVLAATDLTITGVAYDGAVHGLVPEGSLHALVGRVAAVDLLAGELVQVGMWRDDAALAVGEDRVGAVLAPGRFPRGLASGDLADAASLGGLTDTAAGEPAVTVRVLDVQETADGGLSVTLAVAATDAVHVAQLAATEQLLLVGRPTEAQP